MQLDPTAQMNQGHQFDMRSKRPLTSAERPRNHRLRKKVANSASAASAAPARPSGMYAKFSAKFSSLEHLFYKLTVWALL
jgi:hypothetical protein